MRSFVLINNILLLLILSLVGTPDVRLNENENMIINIKTMLILISRSEVNILNIHQQC